MTPGGRLIANHVKSRMQPVFTLTKKTFQWVLDSVNLRL